MRIFFIVAAAVLFADFVEDGLRLWHNAYRRITEKALGATEEQYTDQYVKEHPHTMKPLIPLLWLAVVVIGFLWAVLGH